MVRLAIVQGAGKESWIELKDFYDMPKMEDVPYEIFDRNRRDIERMIFFSKGDRGWAEGKRLLLSDRYSDIIQKWTDKLTSNISGDKIPPNEEYIHLCCINALDDIIYDVGLCNAFAIESDIDGETSKLPLSFAIYRVMQKCDVDMMLHGTIDEKTYSLILDPDKVNEYIEFRASIKVDRENIRW